MKNGRGDSSVFFCDCFPLLLFNYYLLTQYVLLSKETRHLFNSFEKMCCNERYSFEKMCQSLVYSLEKV